MKQKSNSISTSAYELTTPPYAFEALAPFLPPPAFNLTLIDPCAGKGVLTTAMLAKGYKIAAGELRKFENILDSSLATRLKSKYKTHEFDTIKLKTMIKLFLPHWNQEEEFPNYLKPYEAEILTFFEYWKVAFNSTETGIDFFKDNRSDYSPLAGQEFIQVSNPQFDIKTEWLLHSIRLFDRFALLLPGEYVFTQKFAEIARSHKIEIIAPIGRINFGTPDFSFGGSENKMLLPYWQTVRELQGVKKTDKKYNATPSSQFPCAWFTKGLGVGSALTYSPFTRKAFFDLSIEENAGKPPIRKKRDIQA